MSHSRKGRLHCANDPTRKAYRAGYADGRAAGQKLLSCAVKTNHELWRSMLKLDDERPAGETGVELSVVFAETLVQVLQSAGYSRHAELLERHVKRANKNTRDLIQKLQSFVSDLDK